MATTISGTGTPALTSPGIGSGLDVNSIVSKLMAVEQQPVTALDTKIGADQGRISAFGTVKSALASLQASLSGLSSAATFRPLTANVGDTTVATATIGTGAVAGTYSLEVTQRAQAQKLVSAGVANVTDAVGTGTLSFDFGTFNGTTFTSAGAGVKTVTIGASQNTLAGIRDAVNAANIGVAATIVNDGSAAGNRLVFSVAATGAANSLRLTVNDADGNNTDTAGLSQLAYDPAAAAGSGRNLTQSLAAQDAMFNLDGIAIRKPTNIVTDAIQGVTLNLLKTNTGLPTPVSVTANTSSVSSAVSGFVKAFNNLDTTLDSLTKYDATKKQASVLTGDSTVRTIQNQLRSFLGGALGSGPYTTLSQVGLTFQKDGSLAFDSTKLEAALNANPNAVTQLFTATASASDAQMSVGGFTTTTKPGTYAVSISTVPKQGTLQGSAAAGLTITAGVNDQLVATVNGVSATITLTAGTYATAAALATEVQSKVNGASALVQAGASVIVNAAASGMLTVTSARYGNTSAVALAGSAAAGLVGAAPVATAGADAAGSIGGINAITGLGQTLRGATGTAVDGLSLSVNGGAAGVRGSVTYSTGFAYRLNDMLTAMLATGGVVATRTDGLNSEINDLNKRKDEINARLVRVEHNYRAQFNSLDTLLSTLNTQSSYLTQQLAALPKIGS